MENARQRAFLKLRPPCVELSALALKFRGKQTSIKSVLLGLQELQEVLRDLGQQDVLDPKLAEYAFFPLSHIFNESQRLSSGCLETALESLQILVSKGWRQNLLPEMGKQLLILMTLLAGGSPGKVQAEAPADDLKVASFACIETIVEWMSKPGATKSIFDDDGTKTIVDQITYLSLEAITDSHSELVPLVALRALSRLTESIRSRVLLASLLPRTISALTKALRPSTEARRTQTVLAGDLRLFTQTIQSVLSDNRVYGDRTPSVSQKGDSNEDPGEHEILDESWLKATSSQVKIALINVSKLRNHNRAEVREALLELCLMVIEQCSESLAGSLPIMIETMVVLANDRDSLSANSALKHLATSDPSISDMLKSSLYSWSMSLPRLMQGSDDKPKQRALQQISTAFNILADTGSGTDMLTDSMASTLVDSVSTALQVAQLKPRPAIAKAPAIRIQALTVLDSGNSRSFQPVLLDHKSQEGSLTALQSLIQNLKEIDQSNNITRAVVDRVPDGEVHAQLASMWLALNLLRCNKSDFMIDDMIEESLTSTSLRNSKPYLVSDLYSFAVPMLLENVDSNNDIESDWRLHALALECLILQAEQLGTSYRPELIDSLYPVLSLLGSYNQNLQAHAMTALNLLASACEYSSTKDLLVENVDYLVNSIAIKLNSFDLSPQAPQVLLMMVRLCGASLIPYLDDLIGSIFASLDNFHGYPELVELLFEVLKAVVDESAKKPQLAVTDGKTPEHRKKRERLSNVDHIFEDVLAAKGLRRKHDSERDEKRGPAPRRPWYSSVDETDTDSGLKAIGDVLAENDEDPAFPPDADKNKEKTLSKPHQLLLSISQATTPHLSSPSPHVRLTLLQLLDRIAPLLSQDENSFLPLINSVWPALVARLFSEVGSDGEGEAAYNVCAAAETISRLCEGAGDFMASRIEGVFDRLARLYEQVWRRVTADNERRSRRPQAQRGSGSAVHGTVNLQLVQSGAGPVTPAAFTAFRATSADAQICNALMGLMVAILLHVRVTDDTGDTILSLLAPVLDEPGRENVLEALETWNADAVWLVRERRKIEAAMVEGRRGREDWGWRGVVMPEIDGSLGSLRTVVF